MQGKVSIIVDHRERYSGISRLLVGLGAEITEEQLAVGDYILSDRMAVERKRATDFLDSLIKKRLFDQIGRLADAYQRPVLLIEGEGLFSRNVNIRARIFCCYHKKCRGDGKYSLRHGRQGAVEGEEGGGTEGK